MKKYRLLVFLGMFIVPVFLCLGYYSLSCNKVKVNEELPAPVSVVAEVSASSNSQSLPDSMNKPELNDQGIRVKVIPIFGNVRTSLSAGGVQNDIALKYFIPLFVFNRQKVADQTWYRVGFQPDGTNILGWVPESDVQQWDTRLGLRYARFNEVGEPLEIQLPPLYIYRDEENLHKDIVSGKNENYAAVTSYEYKEMPLMAWPVRQYYKYERPSDKKIFNVYQIIIAGKFSGKDNPASKPVMTEAQASQALQTIKTSIQNLDLVFVVDSTQSMAPWIEEVKKSVSVVSQQVIDLKLNVTLRFGLVEYHDRVDGLYFPDGNVYRIFSLTENYQDFLAKVSAVTEASVSSIDFPEAMFEGLDAAIDSDKVGWSQSKLSEKVIILIGDNSGHLPDSPKNPTKASLEGVIKKCKNPNKKIRIFSLIAPNRGPDVEIQIHEMQFNELAIQTLGAKFSLNEYGNVVPAISQIVGNRSEVIETRLQIVDAVVANEIDLHSNKPKTEATQHLKVEDIVEVLEFVKSASGYDLSQLKPGESSMKLGWITDQALATGRTLVEREVFLSRTEGWYFLEEMSSLQNRLLAKPDELKKMLYEAINQRSGENDDGDLKSFFETQSDFLKMKEFYLIMGIPCKENSILTFTFSDIMNNNIPESLKQDLVSSIRMVCLPGLNNCLNSQRRFPGSDQHQFGWAWERFFL